MEEIIKRYSQLPGNVELVFNTLCALISEQPSKVDWSGFGEEEWKLFEKMSIDEGIAPMAYYELNSRLIDFRQTDFDPQTFTKLSQSEAANTIRNAILFNHLWTIVKILLAHDIPIVLLKGSDVAQSLYPEPGLRLMGDLDLLVKKDQFLKTLNIVREQGYDFYLPELTSNIYLLLGKHAHLKHEGKVPIILELHWSLVRNDSLQFAISLDWIWQNLEIFQVERGNLPQGSLAQIYVLNPTANLMYLAAHQVYQHGAKGTTLGWLLDIHLLLSKRQNDIDWNKIVGLADSVGWTSALELVLETVKLYFSSPIPEDILLHIKSQPRQNDYLTSLNETPPTRVLDQWKMLRDLKVNTAIQVVIALLFPSPSYLRYRYNPKPKWIWPVYYLYRWIDIFIDGLQTLVTLIHKQIKNN